MAIIVNVQTERAVPQVNDEGLALVILRNAVPKSPTVEGDIVKIDAYDVSALDAILTTPATGDNLLAEAQEIYALEYLINRGVSVLVYFVENRRAFTLADDIPNIVDVTELGYKFIVSPFSYVAADDDEDVLTAFVANTKVTEAVAYDSVRDIQLFLDLTPLAAATDIPLITLVDASPKIELFINSGFTSEGSRFTSIIDFGADNESLFKGIPASLAALVRKVKLMKEAKPWIPVAGERNGKIAEFTSLERDLTTVEKELFQAGYVNVLISRVGIGPLFVSQNTQYGVADDTLMRSHAVTTALAVKRYLITSGLSTEFLPNNQKTWDNLQLQLEAYLSDMKQSEGITTYVVSIGKGITMTAEEIEAGILKIAVSFNPISVVKKVTFNVTISETNNIYNVNVTGGVL